MKSPTIDLSNYLYSPANVIGRGSFSTVYRGTHKCTGETLAIKKINNYLNFTPGDREFLEHEIQALSELHHPNIIHYHEAILQEDSCYLVTEICEGLTLHQIIREGKKLQEWEVWEILGGIISGFCYMAEHHYIHRDMKPENIMVSGVGEGRYGVKIIDLGFCKKISPSASSFKQTRNVGSVLYQPPETLKSNTYSPKSDIWAIGLMAYEMLCGTTPWHSRTERGLIKKMQLLPVSYPEDISPKIREFIAGCLSVNVGERVGVAEMKQWQSWISTENKRVKIEALESKRENKRVQSLMQSKDSTFRKQQSFLREQDIIKQLNKFRIYHKTLNLIDEDGSNLYELASTILRKKAKEAISLLQHKLINYNDHNENNFNGNNGNEQSTCSPFLKYQRIVNQYHKIYLPIEVKEQEHEQQIPLSQIENPKVRKLIQFIIHSQESSIDELEKVYVENFGGKGREGMGRQGKAKKMDEKVEVEKKDEREIERVRETRSKILKKFHKKFGRNQRIRT